MVGDFNDNNIVNAALTVLSQAKIYGIPVQGIHLSQQIRLNLSCY